MPTETDAVTGFQRDVQPEPTRPMPCASTDELAARQTAKALARIRAGQVPDSPAAEDWRCANGWV